MSALLEAQSVSVRIGRKTLLADVDLSFDASETVALVGPNGAGKTTLLRVLSGEFRPRSGQVRLQGRALGAYAPRALAKRRAVLSQRVGVALPFTVADIARLGAGEERGTSIESMIDAALAEVELIDLAHRTITTLSGGEQQRAHFARVLVQLACAEASGGPGVLLLDEFDGGARPAPSTRHAQCHQTARRRRYACDRDPA